MDSLGDYIYLIIIALAGLSSFFKKKKKDAETSQIPNDDEPDFREIFGGPKPEKDWWEDETVYAPQPVVEEIKPPLYSQERIVLETAQSYENTNDVQKLRIKKTIQESSLKNNFAKATLEPENDENPFLNNIRLNNVEDARRAFIYTEIFNRKY